jgi:hypothetical protein
MLIVIVQEKALNLKNEGDRLIIERKFEEAASLYAQVS